MANNNLKTCGAMAFMWGIGMLTGYVRCLNDVIKGDGDNHPDEVTVKPFKRVVVNIKRKDKKGES